MTYEEQDAMLLEIETENMGIDELRQTYLNRVSAAFEIECEEPPF